MQRLPDWRRRKLRVRRHRCRLWWEKKAFDGKRKVAIRNRMTHFANMPGGQLLEHARDELSKLAFDRREYWRRNQRFSQNPLSEDWLERAALLDGISAALEYVVAVGRSKRMSKGGAQPPEWVLMLVAQIRAQLIDQLEKPNGGEKVVEPMDRARAFGADPRYSPPSPGEPEEDGE